MLFEDEKYQCPVLYKMGQMLKGARQRALLKNRGFNIDLDDLVNCYVEICPVLDIDILWYNKDVVCHGSPSLDRINNTKGYIKGNIQIISHRANSLKKDYLLCEWEKMRNYMTQCDGNPVDINENHFKKENGLTDIQDRNIRASLKKKQSILEISEFHEVSVGQVINVLRRNNF